MFFQQPTPPPPLHSLILQSILQHLHGGYQPVFQPPVQVYAPHRNPGTLGQGPNQPGQVVSGPAARPAPGGLNAGPNQPAQQVPGVTAPDPYGGGGDVHSRVLHRIISGLL